MKLDLISGLAYDSSTVNGEGKPITEEEKEAAIIELQRATRIANSVTSNMTMPRFPGVAKAYVAQPPVEQ